MSPVWRGLHSPHLLIRVYASFGPDMDPVGKGIDQPNGAFDEAHATPGPVSGYDAAAPAGDQAAAILEC